MATLGCRITAVSRNQFTLIPGENVWRMQPRLRPQVDGPCIARVVGPDTEEIYCDEDGRVKLHFPWDRYSDGNEKSSCWVRVSQDWAGAQYGMIAIPRIGHEVIVSFLNGDPDQPVVTGRAYHATNTPPYPLPENKTKTVLRTKTHQGEGFNELSFEDQSGQEKIDLHGQKDYAALIENDVTVMIGHDAHLTVENERFTQVKVDDHQSVDGEQRIKVAKNFSSEIQGDLQQKVTARVAVEAGRALSLQSGAKIVIEAGAQITLKAGGSFMTVSSGGVDMSGPGITLNAGGSPGSATPYGGLAALLPGGVEAPPAPDELLLAPQSATMTSLLPALSALDLPMMEVCQKQTDGSCTKTDCQCIQDA